MGPLARMIAPVIGLTQEGLAARKASKEAAAQREAAAQSSQASSSSSSRPPYQNNYQDAPPLYDSRSDGRMVSPDSKQGQSQYENGRPDLYYGGVEEEWELDEASHELTQGPTNTNEPELSEAEITDAFLQNHPPPAYMPSNNMGRLPCPVIIPQRRPGDKKRGFVRAYAPVLENCGIDQATFVDFLKSFHAASKASPYFMVIFLGAGIVGFVPTLTTTIISSSIQLAVGAAMEVQSRTRSTSFLDRLNREFFQPRGLFCMIMAYKPDEDSTHERVDINQAISSSLDPKTGMKGQFSKLKATSGKTYGEMELPQAAPLVFPVLDDLADDDSEEAKNMKDKMKNKTKFMRGYMDKRAQAKFAYENPGSSLSTDPSSQFASIYSDPSHPANSGSFISMVTGGAVNPKGMRQERRDKVMSKIGRGKDVPTQQNAFGKRQPRGPIRKMMKKDVLYLTIVNMPTEGELEAARRAVAEAAAQS